MPAPTSTPGTPDDRAKFGDQHDDPAGFDDQHDGPAELSEQRDEPAELGEQRDNPTASDDQHDDSVGFEDERDQPIDPTRTFDAYFDKQEIPPTTPVEAVRESDGSAEGFTDPADPEPDPSGSEHGERIDSDHSDHDDSEDREPEHSDSGHSSSSLADSSLSGPGDSGSKQIKSESSYFTKPLTESSSTPDTAEPSYSGASYSGTSYSASTSSYPTGTPPTSPVHETAAPATYSGSDTVPPAAANPALPESSETGPRTARMRTVVLGLVLLVIAGAVLIGQLTNVTVNVSAVLLALMIGGGILLIVGARRT